MSPSAKSADINKGSKKKEKSQKSLNTATYFKSN